MSTKYKHSHEVPTAVLAKRLDELSDAIGKRGEERDRELTRRVPAELDRDADLVLLEASTRLLKMEAEVARLNRQVCEVAGEADWADHVAETSREELEEVGGENYTLTQERDAALEQIIYWRERASAAEGETAALAAHVERLSDAAKRYYNATCGEPMVNIESPLKRKIDEANAAMDALESAIKSAPSTSLARRDLLKQAEAFELAERHAKCELDAVMLRANAADLRRQAEGSEQ